MRERPALQGIDAHYKQWCDGCSELGTIGTACTRCGYIIGGNARWPEAGQGARYAGEPLTPVAGLDRLADKALQAGRWPFNEPQPDGYTGRSYDKLQPGDWGQVRLPGAVALRMIEARFRQAP